MGSAIIAFLAILTPFNALLASGNPATPEIDAILLILLMLAGLMAAFLAYEAGCEERRRNRRKIYLGEPDPAGRY